MFFLYFGAEINGVVDVVGDGFLVFTLTGDASATVYIYVISLVGHASCKCVCSLSSF